MKPAHAFFSAVLWVCAAAAGSIEAQEAGADEASPVEVAVVPARDFAAQQKGSLEGRISLDLRSIDINDALKFLVMKTGLNIVTTKSVSGRVTLMVHNAPIQDVFDIMLRSNDLAYDKQGEVFSVMSKDEYRALYGKNFSDVRAVEIFHLNYAVPSNVFNLVDTLKSEIGRVLVDTESGTVMVMDAPDRIEMIKKAIENFEQKSLIRVFKLNYARAEDVQEALKSQLDTKRVGSIKSDARSNQVVVQTLPSRMAQVEDLIRELDRKTYEIILDARIIIVNLSDDFEQGVEWEGLFNLGKKFGLTYLGSYPFSSVQSSTDTYTTRKEAWANAGYVGSYPFTGTSTDYAAGNTSMGTELMHIGVVGRHDFDVAVKYLQTVGETRILSNPKLAVVNNQEAKIHVGRKEAYVTTTTTSGSATSTISEQITFIDIGVLLSVVPTINHEGFITMKVKAEVTSVIDTLITPTDNEIPILDTSLAETTVMAKDGSTIIIGGLRKETETETTKRVPLLASIPLLGKVFQDTTKTKARTELVIILTPKLITGETMVTNVGIEGAGLEAIKSVKGYEDMPRQRVEAFPSEVYVPMDAPPVPIKGPKGF